MVEKQTSTGRISANEQTDAKLDQVTRGELDEKGLETVSGGEAAQSFQQVSLYLRRSGGQGGLAGSGG